MVYRDIINIPLCKNKKIYFFSYFMFLVTNLIGFICVKLFLNKENCGDDLIIIQFLFMFFAFVVSIIISRCLCLKFHENVYENDLMYNVDNVYYNT